MWSVKPGRLPGVLLGLALLAFLTPGCSDEGGFAVSGSTTDEAGQAATAAQVLMQFVESGEVFEASIEDDRFEFKGLPPDGTFILLASDETGDRIGTAAGAITDNGLVSVTNGDQHNGDDFRVELLPFAAATGGSRPPNYSAVVGGFGPSAHGWLLDGDTQVVPR